MKKLLLLIAFAVANVVAGAQKVYFVYLQSESGEAFYLNMGGKVYSSAAGGYLILSNLRDSTYTFQLGFAGKNKETKFAVAVKGEDRGFVIKTIDGALSLFDLENLTVLKSISFTDMPVMSEELLAKADPFTRMLSQAADDPHLLYAAGPNVDTQKEENVAVVVAPLVKTDSVATVNKIVDVKPELVVQKDTVKSVAIETPKVVDKPIDTVKVVPQVETEVFKRSVVTRHSESSTTEGFGLVFFDKGDDVDDTIRILIPNPKFVAKEEGTVVVPQKDSAQKMVTDADAKKPDVARSTVTDTVMKSTDTLRQQSKAPACGVLATDKDFFSLRKVMAAVVDEEQMLAVAKEEFNTKCFTVKQIKNLGVLMLTQKGKYDFYEAAYKHTSDREQFAQLQTEFTEEEYSKRFKALIGQ